MKISYKQFIDNRKVQDVPIYLILGKPYHLLNEVQHKVENHFRKITYSQSHLIADSDFDIYLLNNDFQSLSLFSEKKVITISIVSNTPPKSLLTFLLDNPIPNDLKIVLKLGSQSPAFKKSKFYSMIEKIGCIIEITELRGTNLNNWVKNKFIKNKIKYTDDAFVKLIEKNEGNTSSISQELYKMSLLNISDVSTYFDYLEKEYKYTEFDLIDCLLENNLIKSRKILDYLRATKSPEVYILFLLNNEMKKIYYLSNNILPHPFIPNFKRDLYNKVSKNMNKTCLVELLEYCYSIDKNIKLGINDLKVWHQLEILISSFILNKPPSYLAKRII